MKTMTLSDGVAYVESPPERVRLACIGCELSAFSRLCKEADYVSRKEFGGDCRKRNVIYIKAFEYVCGNSAISQWIAMGAKLTVLEEIQAARLVA